MKSTTGLQVSCFLKLITFDCDTHRLGFHSRTCEVCVSFHQSTRFPQHDRHGLSDAQAWSAIWDSVFSSVFAQGHEMRHSCDYDEDIVWGHLVTTTIKLRTNTLWSRLPTWLDIKTVLNRISGHYGREPALAAGYSLWRWSIIASSLASKGLNFLNCATSHLDIWIRHLVSSKSIL